MRKRMQALLKNEKGFTLVELLAVIVILGIIAAIAIPSIGKIIDNSKKDAIVANAQQLVGAARLAVAANETALWATTNADGTTGDTGEGANIITLKDLIDAGYLESAIKDPDSDGNYTAAYVVYNKAANTYTVTLTGTRSITGEISTIKRSIIPELN